ncbi:aminoglycoside 6-adenylyltransferase [Oceanobacillus sp. CAU 1775]
MRTEKEMYDLIVGIAQKDQRIRAVYMNGSRTNPNVPKDIFQDYDIVYVVKETGSFIKDKKWINAFGNLLMIQEPNKNDKDIGMETNFDNSYGYLMLFTDGNRIDLHIETKEAMTQNYTKEKLTIPLLDKDNIFPSTPQPSDKDYWVKKPSEAHFSYCCNEFWWSLQNIGKGIWRDELPYVKQTFELVVRVQLDKMVSWWIGMNHEFRVSAGKMGKYFKQYLPASYWKMYKNTYADDNYENIWDSLFIACELFRMLAKEIGKRLSFTYPMSDNESIKNYLQHVRQLPTDSQSIY